MAHNGKLENYLKGLRDGMGIGIAYTPFGITIGLISKNFGMKLFTAIVMSFGLYAGSAQTAFLKMVYEPIRDQFAQNNLRQVLKITFAVFLAFS